VDYNANADAKQIPRGGLIHDKSHVEGREPAIVLPNMASKCNSCSYAFPIGAPPPVLFLTSVVNSVWLRIGSNGSPLGMCTETVHFWER